MVKYSPSSIYLMHTFKLSSTTNQSVMLWSLFTEVCTDTIISASVYHRPQRFFKKLSSKFYVQSKESNRTWMILHLKVQTWTIIFVYSDSFSKPCAKQEWSSSVRNVSSFNLLSSTSGTSSAVIAFDLTLRKLRQSSRLRPQQIENNKKVSSG